MQRKHDTACYHLVLMYLLTVVVQKHPAQSRESYLKDPPTTKIHSTKGGTSFLDMDDRIPTLYSRSVHALAQRLGYFCAIVWIYSVHVLHTSSRYIYGIVCRGIVSKYHQHGLSHDLACYNNRSPLAMLAVHPHSVNVDPHRPPKAALPR